MDDSTSHLVDELENFQDLARFIHPSSGEIPRLPGVEIAGLTIPLYAGIGGDHIVYIDFKARYDLDQRIDEADADGRTDVAENLRVLRNRGGILLADVSGHRMTDSLIAAMLHQAFLLGVLYELELSGEITTRLFEFINTRFYRTTATSKFFTMIYGEIDVDGRFRFVSAGHHPPAVFSREFGRFMPISKEQLISFPPVGLLPSRPVYEAPGASSLLGYKKLYKINEISLLAVGDLMVLQTDGLSEHGNGDYFPAGLEELLRRDGDRPVAELCGLIQADLERYGDREDDISFVLVRKTA